MPLSDHVENTRYGWLTPAYLAGLDADVVVWCADAPLPGCRYRSEWTHEQLAERFGERQDLWAVPWVCPMCGGKKVTFTVLVRGTAG